MQDTPFSLLASRSAPWSSFAFSLGVQALAVLLLVEIGLIRPQKLIPPHTLYSLTALVITPPPQRKAAPPQKSLSPVAPPAATVAKLRTPAVVPVRPSEIVPRPEIPRAELASVVPARTPKVQVVHTGAFESTGSRAVSATIGPARQVQTGGFGDPNGIKGEGKPGAKAVVASVGSFDLPQGPAKGNGTGRASGVQGTVASVGFGTGIAIGNSDRPSGSRGTVQQSGFGDTRPVEAARPARVVPTAAKSTAVEVLSKPKPVYTEEARALRLEGEVLLQVVFQANGECRVERVIRGLGHGLDEAAMRAAQQIRFRPATRDGAVVDSTASLHVVFQLAY